MGTSVAPAEGGGVLVTGHFFGGVDLSPDTSGDEISVSSNDAFVAKLDGEGRIVWFDHFGAGEPPLPRSLRLATGPAGVVLAGGWAKELDFGAAQGPLAPKGGLDVFVASFPP
jgi:hypothetical protein